MKKIIIKKEILDILDKRRSFLNRSDIMVFPVANNKEVLSTHSREMADLIVTSFDSPDINGHDLCNTIREDDRLSKVSIILICPKSIDIPDKLVELRANSLLPSTFSPDILIEEAQRLLNIAHRQSLRTDLSIEIQGSRAGMDYRGMIENISSSGILFQSDIHLDEGDRILCSFRLPGKIEISTTAEIVRAVEGEVLSDGKRYYYYGASFVDIAPDVQKTIEEFIESCRE